ncbi:MAG: transposase [Deltaproteobacteria bacterium]|nr:transposase [Deltaproteobacteria bacterium]
MRGNKKTSLAVNCSKFTGKKFSGQSFWARGYFVSTVGGDQTKIRESMKKQGSEDRRID